MKAIEGQPIAGNTVTLTANQGSSQITPSSAVTNSSGEAIFTVTDTVVETITYTATDITENVQIAQQAVVSFVEPPPLPPQQLEGFQKKNDFAVVIEYYNTLIWKPSPSDVEGYYVYRNGIKIATLGASSLSYEDHNRKKGQETLYSVTSFIGNLESIPVSIIVK